MGGREASAIQVRIGGKEKPGRLCARITASSCPLDVLSKVSTTNTTYDTGSPGEKTRTAGLFDSARGHWTTALTLKEHATMGPVHTILPSSFPHMTPTLVPARAPKSPQQQSEKDAFQFRSCSTENSGMDSMWRYQAQSFVASFSRVSST
ncbi:hypothetical protein AOQ84DRAFT_355802 [Glonium stellatum]|uniref:Uncharacterized protein n=1 Tax=Glonium stellatum TaxID=574774 RepID=A0A8E2EWU2_9PEZI|nr:hypothetical protein AOQ84DRAFT_355802 [Glonium stellatum]